LQGATDTRFPSAKYWTIFKEGVSEANMLYTELMRSYYFNNNSLLFQE